MIDYAYKIKMCPWKKWPVRTDGLPYFSSDVKLKVFAEQVKQKQREGHYFDLIKLPCRDE